MRTVEAGDTVARRRHDRDRARDRGRQHLQARHPLLGAARRHLPRRERQRAADRDGQLRDRPGADRRRGDRAGRRREGHRLAARRSRPGRSTWSRSARPGEESARPPTGSTRSSREAGARGRSTTTATPGRGRSSPTPSCSAARCGSWSASAALAEGEVEAQRAAPRAPTTGCAVAEAAARARELLEAPRRLSERPHRPRRSLRRLFGLDRSGPLADADPRRGAAAPVDDPEPGRLPAARRDPGLPRPRASTPTTGASPSAALLYLAIAAGDYLDGFLARAPASTAAWGRCSTRSSTGSTILAGAVVCWHFELLPRWALALLAVARGGRRWSSPSSALRRGRRPRDQLGRADRASSRSSAGSSVAWSSTAGSPRRGVPGRRRARRSSRPRSTSRRRRRRRAASAPRKPIAGSTEPSTSS